MPLWGDELVDTADVLGTTADDGEIRAKVGYAVSAQGTYVNLPFYGPDGFISSPNQPSENGDACQALYIRDGDGRIIIGTRDNRYADKVGSFEPGDRGIVTDGEARILIKQATDSIFAMTVDQTVDRMMMFEMNGQDGALKLFCGNSWIELTDKTVTIGVDEGKAIFSMDKDGFQLRGSSFVCATSSGQLGLMADPAVSIPAPAFSIVAGPTGLAGVGSPKWTVSPL